MPKEASHRIALEWEETGWLIRPRNYRELMGQVARLGAYARSHRIAWRGMQNANFRLTSTLERSLTSEDNPHPTEDDLRYRETRILQEARRWGLDIVGGTRVDDFQLLTDLQHYGVPTRLIDFTSNPMTALWFACETEPKPKRNSVAESGVSWAASGLLLAVNIEPWYVRGRRPTELNTVFETVVEGPWVGGDDGGNIGVYMTTVSTRLESALALNSPFIVGSSTPNPRLRAQEGYFIGSALPARDATAPIPAVVSSWKWPKPPGRGSKSDLEIIRDGVDAARGFPRTLPFVAFYIDAGWKSALRDLLKRNYHQKASVLFPDFTGFASRRPWL